MNKLKKSIGILGVAAALALGGAGFSATPAAPFNQKAEAYTLTHCYRAMDGRTWCWRTSCTWFERYALGCTDAWVPTTKYWYA